MKTYVNILTLFLIFLIISCKSPSIIINTAPSKYGDIEILAVTKKKTEKVILFVPDDDTVSIEKQVQFLLPMLGKNTSLYTFPKYHYQNSIEKDNADNPFFRLELLVAAYQNLVANETIDKTQTLVVLGLGEGSLIAPHFSRLVNASSLLLINPMYHSYKENFTIAYTEKTGNSEGLKSYLGFAYHNEWLEFFEDVEHGVKPDKSAGSRTYRYFNSYWNYYPGNFIGSKVPTKLVIFKDYYLSSEYDKQFMTTIKQPNIVAKQIEGCMFSNFSESELKKLNWF